MSSIITIMQISVFIGYVGLLLFQNLWAELDNPGVLHVIYLIYEQKFQYFPFNNYRKYYIFCLN